MANITMYNVDSYKSEYYKIFSGVYNNFKENAASEYNFELEPLSYENFVQSIEKGLLECLILFEDSIPTGFLVYTTLVSESIELNIIHCIGTENLNAKRKLLMDKFLELSYNLRKEKVVTYPLLGIQAQFVNRIRQIGFKTINTSVLAFTITDVNAINKLNEIYAPQLPLHYTMTNWKPTYLKQAAQIVNSAFKNSSDAQFDKRYTSEKGSMDIVEKITSGVYGEFLPEITKVLLYKNRPIGVFFANLTNNKIANIPITAILKKHQNIGLGRIVLKQLVDNLLNISISQGWGLKELNVSCDTDNISAYKMYTGLGFTPQYTYLQAYLPKIN